MGMEPLNSISTLQAQPMTKTVPAPKASSETTDGNTTTDITTTVPKVDNTTSAVAKKQESEGSKQSYENQEQNSPTGREALKKAVENINKNLSNSEAIFGFHDTTNRVTIKIVDKDTKELIRELPPEKTLDMIAKVWELAGLMVDEKR